MSQDESPDDAPPGVAVPVGATDLGSLSHESNEAAFGHRPGEPDLHHHVALLYEDRDDQFAAVLPFLREGLERGDRCIYIHDDNDEETVEAAMREAGIDVEDALAPGDLSLHCPNDIFLDDGTFEPEGTIEFAIESIREAVDDGGYETLRIAGEMTWVLDGEHDLDRMIEYERALNEVFGTRPVVGICQYNTERFDPEVLNQIVRVHPNLVYAGAAARDFYYVPADRLGAESGAAEAAELRQTLLERVTAYEALERRERALGELNDAARELMHLDGDAIPERAVELVQDVLDVPFASFWAYDEDSGELELRTSSSDHDTTTALAARYEEHAWEAFVSEQTAEYDDLPVDTDAAAAPTQLESGVIVPLGRHGVFCAGSVHEGAFDETEVTLANTLGANVESALDRADRERALADANEQLERVNRLNRVIRGISEALVEADTRSAIEQIVCERLAASDAYRFVWIGDREFETGRVEPSAWAGDHRTYLDEVEIAVDDESTADGPVTAALETGTPQVVQDVLTDPAFKPWREPTLRAGFRATASVPLVYEGVRYGVLTLYAGSTSVFDEREQAVLGELGELIAHAIDAAETRETLRADSVAELTVSARSVDGVLARLAGEFDAEIHFEGLVPDADAGSHLFVSIPDADPDRVTATGAELRGVDAIQLLDRHEDGARYETTVTEPTIASHILERQAAIRSLTVTDADATAVVDLPSTADVRTFLDQLRTNYPDVELMSRKTHERSITTDRELRSAVDEELTDRQWEVLEMAYRSGFFESPRAQTGSQIADALDISQSTFTHHLREAERRLGELVFDD